MSALRGKLWAKITALGLAVLLILLCCFCLLATVYMAQSQLYSDGGAAARQRILSGSRFDTMCSLLERYVQECYWYRSSGLGDTAYYEEQFRPEVSNFFFTAEAEDGSL